MARRQGFGDVELMLTGDDTDAGYLSSIGYCVTSTPSDLKTRLNTGYVLRVARTGGGDNKTEDNPRVNVQVFAKVDYTNPRAAHEGAELVREQMFNLPAVTPWGLLDSAGTESGPVRVPWADPEVTVVQVIFRVTTRRR